jgi:hypothetical protein
MNFLGFIENKPQSYGAQNSWPKIAENPKGREIYDVFFCFKHLSYLTYVKQQFQICLVSWCALLAIWKSSNPKPKPKPKPIYFNKHFAIPECLETDTAGVLLTETLLDTATKGLSSVDHSLQRRHKYGSDCFGTGLLVDFSFSVAEHTGKVLSWNQWSIHIVHTSLNY